MSPLLVPPADLTGFPAFRLLPSQSLVRIHRADHGPWWFGSSGFGRFDLALPRGTCYLAATAIGAVVEAFQEPGPVIPEAVILARRVSILRFTSTVVLADCTDPRTRRFGLTGEIHSSDARQLTRAWAEGFDRSGFGGVRYLLRHDPSQQEIGIALFGSAGEANLPVVSTGIIGTDLMLDADRRFGIKVQRAGDLP